MGAGLTFGILGPLEVKRGATPVPVGGPRQRALLAFLLCHANRVVSRDQLIDELLGDQPADSAERMLRVHVSRLRKALADGEDAAEPRLRARPPGYVLAVADGELDLHTFDDLTASGRQALADGDAARAAALLRRAESLWRGRPLADLESESFTASEVQRLEALRLGMIEDRIEAELAVGRDTSLCSELERLVADHPLHERLREQLDGRALPQWPTGRRPRHLPRGPVAAGRGARGRAGAAAEKAPAGHSRPGPGAGSAAPDGPAGGRPLVRRSGRGQRAPARPDPAPPASPDPARGAGGRRDHRAGRDRRLYSAVPPRDNRDDPERQPAGARLARERCRAGDGAVARTPQRRGVGRRFPMGRRGRRRIGGPHRPRAARGRSDHSGRHRPQPHHHRRRSGLGPGSSRPHGVQDRSADRRGGADDRPAQPAKRRPAQHGQPVDFQSGRRHRDADRPRFRPHREHGADQRRSGQPGRRERRGVGGDRPFGYRGTDRRQDGYRDDGDPRR